MTVVLAGDLRAGPMVLGESGRHWVSKCSLEGKLEQQGKGEGSGPVVFPCGPLLTATLIVNYIADTLSI